MSNNTIIKGRNKQAIAPREEYLECNVSSLGNLQTDATSICMGSEDGTASGTQHQLKVDSTGALHIISENADSMLIKGVETGTTIQRDCKQNANGDLRVQLVANDGNDGGGQMRIVGCNSNGFLKVKDDELETNLSSGLFTTQLAGRTTITDTATKTNLLCDTDGHLQVDIVSGGGSGGVQYAVGTTGLTSGTGTLLIGSAGGTATEAEMSVLGALNIKVTEATNLGTSANLASNATIASDGLTSVVNISNFNNANILYEDTNVGDYNAVSVEASCNSSDYFIIETIFPSANPANTKRLAYRSLNVAGLTNLRIRNISSSTSVNNVYATVVGSP